MSETQKTYAAVFREGTVWIVGETTGPIAQVAHHLGANEGTTGQLGEPCTRGGRGHHGLSKEDVKDLKRERCRMPRE